MSADSGSTMISTDYIRLMAAYTGWQNHSIYAAGEMLSDAERRRERGAFFGSIHATLCHLLWGDRMWMHRFAGTALPQAASIAESGNMVPEWVKLK